MHFASLLWNSVTFDVIAKRVKIVANSFENDIIVMVRFKGRRTEKDEHRTSNVQHRMVNERKRANEHRAFNIEW